MSDAARTLLSSLGDGPAGPLYVVAGELILAEPEAERLARALAERAGCPLKTLRRPPSLLPLLEDLRTYSLFDSAKVVLAVDTAVLADKKVAADLVDEAAKVLPLSGGGELASGEREAASLLMQALRLFGADPAAGGPEQALDALPDWAFQGGAAFRRGRHGRGRGKRQVEELRAGLAELLTAAREAGLAGYAAGEVAELGSLADGDLPDGHTLVLAERSADADHPLVRRLEKAGRLLRVGELEETKGRWIGLEALAEEMERQTGVGIERGALTELARRTIHTDEETKRDKKKKTLAESESTARFAGEYRKLANLAQGAGAAGITRRQVEASVTDRGEEDVFKLLDAVGEGRAGEALARLGRMLAGAEDPLGERLRFFALFAGYCRNLTAVRGLMDLHGVRPGVGNYGRFKNSLAPRLKADLPGGRKSPVAGLHPYPLHRAYLAASKMPRQVVESLPAWVLETELEIKGESADPEVALAHLLTRLASAAR